MPPRSRKPIRKPRSPRRHWRSAALLAIALLGAALLVWLAFRAADATPDPNIVARVLFAETAGCTPHERLLVAGVMRNRIHNPPFGKSDTLRDVVSQPGAFSCINDSANANWRKSAHPDQMNPREQAVWHQCLDCLAHDIPPAAGPSGRLLVYYHDKSISKPASWDNRQWHALREITTEHFIFYSILPVHPAGG